ncbi:MAG: hypothetical protein K6C94_00960, partial [Candidatus Gastranaerophilales bacterium]|nr:hypothetical protein [Candidatus Gastranaerophilales bacterium]
MKEYIVYVFWIIFIVVFVEIFSYVLFQDCTQERFVPIKELVRDYHYFLPQKYNLNLIKRNFRSQTGNQNKGSIVFVGSTSLGQKDVKRENTLPYMIYKSTDRSVYRFSNEYFGINNIYSLFEDGFVKDNVKNPEYIVYFYYDEDLGKIVNCQLNPNTTLMNKRYKINNDLSVKEIKNHFLLLNSLYFVKCLQYFKEKAELNFIYDKSEFYLLTYLEKIMDKIKVDYPENTPKTIFLYSSQDFDTELQEEIEEMGYILFDVKDVIGERNILDAEDNKIIADKLI